MYHDSHDVLSGNASKTVNTSSGNQTINNQIINYNYGSGPSDEAVDNWHSVFNNFSIIPLSEKTLPELSKDREEDLKKINEENKNVIIIHGLPKIGKTTFVKLWLKEHVNLKYCYTSFDPYKPENKQRLDYVLDYSVTLIDKIVHSKSEYLIIFDDVENANENQLIKLTNFVSHYFGYDEGGIPNLKLIFCTHFINDTSFYGSFPYETFTAFHLLGRDTEENKKLLDALIKSEKIKTNDLKKLKKKYEAHPVLMRSAYDRLLKGTTTCEILLEDDTQNLILLEKSMNKIFDSLSNDKRILTVFQEIVLLGQILHTHDSLILEQLKSYSLLEKPSEKYIIHSYTVSLAKQYFTKNDNGFRTNSKNLLNKLAKQNFEYHYNDKIVDFVRFALSAFLFLEEINSFIDPNEKEFLIYKFQESYKNNPYIIFWVFTDDIEKNIKILDRLEKDIIYEDALYYLAVMYRKQGNNEKALSELNAFFKKKTKEGTFDIDDSKRINYQYYLEKGHLKKALKQSPDSEYQAARDCRNWLNLEEIKNLDGYRKKQDIKTFVMPTHELALYYLKNLSNEKITDDRSAEYAAVNNVCNLLYEDYILLDFYDLKNTALYNDLGDLYQQTNEKKKAISFYEKALEEKTKDYKARYNLAKLYAYQNDYKESYRLLKEGFDKDYFEDNNFEIFCEFGKAARETGRYDESLKYLHKALESTAKAKKYKTIDDEKYVKFNKKVYREIFLTLIKSAQFDEIEKQPFYAESKDILKDVIDKSLKLLLENGSRDRHPDIINWILQNYNYEELSVDTSNFLKSIKCKYILQLDEEKGRKKELLADYLEKYTPNLEITKFNYYGAVLISGESFKLYKKYFNCYEYHRYFLLQYIKFKDKQLQDEEKKGEPILEKKKSFEKEKSDRLKKFFSIFPFNNEYDKIDLFIIYKDSCLSQDKLDFLDTKVYDLMNNDDLINNDDLLKIAKIYIKRRNYTEADKVYSLAIKKYESNIYNYLNYAVFKLLLCELNSFTKIISNAVYGRDANEILFILEPLIKSPEFCLLKPNREISCKEFINSQQMNILSIETKFNFELKPKIMEAFSNRNETKQLQTDFEYFYEKELNKIINQEETSSYKKSNTYYRLAKFYNQADNPEKVSECLDFAITILYDELEKYYEEPATKLKESLLLPLDNEEWQEIGKIKKLLAKECCLKGVILFEKGKYDDAFCIFNRACLKTNDEKLREKLREKKQEKYNRLNEYNKRYFDYEITYTEALKNLESFIYPKKDSKPPKGGWLKAFFENAVESYQRHKSDPIAKDIINIYRLYKKLNPTLPEECIYMLRNHYIHSNDNDFYVNWNLGTLFKEKGVTIRNRKELSRTWYLYAEYFYQKMKQKAKEPTEKFFYYNNLAHLYSAMIKVEDKGLYLNKAYQCFNEAEEWAEKCENEEEKDKFLSYINEGRKEAAENVKSKPSIFDLDYLKGLNKLDSNQLTEGSILKCKLKLIYNYGFFLTYFKDNAYTDGLLHKNEFSKGKEYLIYILRRIKPVNEDFNVKIKSFIGFDNERTPVFTLSEGFEQDVLNALNDYIQKTENEMLNLSGMKLDFLPEILKTQKTGILNITGNPLTKLDLSFFDSMPNIHTIQYDKEQKNLIKNLRANSSKKLTYFMLSDL